MNTPDVLEQTPASLLDYTINWATRGLGTDTIASSSWDIAPAGLSGASPAPSFTASTTTVWLSGGTAGAYYTATNTIITAGGRGMEETFIIKIVAQIFISSNCCRVI
jgi:hypothetical protein